ncbi:MAG TPA: hypothetical protein VKS81_03625 [Bacteroidota bacterium]|nr:hypothetical protein [Bacteroidota bacterium]
MKRLLIVPILLSMIASTLLFGADKKGFDFSSQAEYRLQKTTYTWAKKTLQGFNLQIWLSTQMAMGQEAFDGQTPPTPGCFVGISASFPIGECVEHMFGAGPWIGGLVNGVRHVSEGYNGDDARKEFVGAKKDSLRDQIWFTATSDSGFDTASTGYYKFPMNKRSFDDDGDGRVDEDELDGLDNDGDWIQATDDIGADGVPDSLEVGCRGSYDPVTNPDPAFDDFKPSATDLCHPLANGSFRKMNDPNRYTEKNGIPDHGEPHVDEDYAAISNHDVYMSATDTVADITNIVADHFPMGIKVEQKSYAFSESDLSPIIFFEYHFINVGTNIINRAFVGYFADMDVGPVNVGQYFQHDYACYIDSLRTAYIHNPVDRGATPLGITVLQTPRRLDSLRYIFQWWDFTTRGGPGTVDSLIYNWMSGDQWDSTSWIWPCQQTTELSDTRFMFSFGPFNQLNPGDSLTIWLAFVAGYCIDQCPGSLVENAQTALKEHLGGYHPSQIPPSPKLKITQGFKKVNLEWGPHLGGPNPFTVWDDSNHLASLDPNRTHPPAPGHTSGGRIFEGYRLYRSEDPNGALASFTLLRQWDVKDQFPYNTGIDSTFTDTNLVRGKTYWYAVTSYGIPNESVIPIPDSHVPGGVRYDTLLTTNTESSLQDNYQRVDLAFSTSSTADQVLVVPNPYRTDQNYTYENGGWEGRSSSWTENNRLIKFIHLPVNATVRVFTLAGDLITVLNNIGSPTPGEITWNLLSASNRALASGLYIFTVESKLGRQIGKFAVIR